MLSLGYFPFCILEDEVPAFGYPLNFELKEAMSLYWKVKTWKFTFDGGALGTFTANKRMVPMFGNVDDYAATEITKPAKLVCQAQLAIKIHIVVPPIDVNVTVNFWNPNTIAVGGNIYKSGNAYYPVLAFGYGASFAYTGYTYDEDAQKITCIDANGTYTLEPVDYWDYAGT